MQQVTVSLHAPLARVVPAVLESRRESGGPPAAAMQAPAPGAAARPLNAAPRGDPGQPAAPAAQPMSPQVDALLSQIAESLAAWRQFQQACLNDFQQLAVELAIAVAARLTYEKTSQDQLAIERLVGEAVAEFTTDQPLVVRLHPDDRRQLETDTRVSEAPWLATHQVQLESDPALPRGSCSVDTKSYGLVTDLASRVEGLRQRLLDGIEYARIERRKTATRSPGM